MRRLILSTVAECVCVSWAGTAHAQIRLDQADPSIAERQLPPARPERERVEPAAPLTQGGEKAVIRAVMADRVATAIVVEGTDRLRPAAFSDAIVPFVGRNLSQGDLADLAGAIAQAARRRGFPLATATIGAQDMAGGVLRVTIDEGRIDAVRVIGAINPLADRILTAQLATGRSTSRRQLERAIQLINDIPGVTVKESRFVRQDGFGILLVTIEQDGASAYVQVDNRGTSEIGPIRTTVIGNVRGVFQAGDELGLIASSTPLQASEFAFARVRYSSIIDRFGSVLSLSTSYGRARPGASLKALDVVGNSLDISVSYARPLVRSRSRSLWAELEFRALKVDQKLLGFALRDDRIETLTGSLNGFVQAGGGVLRGDIGVAAGLPLPDVTQAGDPRSSRSDGDARFVTVGYTVEWSRPLGRWLSVALASSGQLASRPLLATAELGLGGQSFGRAYDAAERTGDQGILGSAELRADLRKLVSAPIDRAQVYGFIDGGYVDNLRGGFGGGTLLSGGAGIRLGSGRFDAGAELAVPLNADRFDTGNRRARFSFRIARSF